MYLLYYILYIPFIFGIFSWSALCTNRFQGSIWRGQQAKASCRVPRIWRQPMSRRWWGHFLAGEAGGQGRSVSELKDMLRLNSTKSTPWTFSEHCEILDCLNFHISHQVCRRPVIFLEQGTMLAPRVASCISTLAHATFWKGWEPTNYIKNLKVTSCFQSFGNGVRRRSLGYVGWDQTWMKWNDRGKPMPCMDCTRLYKGRKKCSCGAENSREPSSTRFIAVNHREC